MSNDKYLIQIENFNRENGRTPTFSEMAELFKFKSKNSVTYLINKMVERGELNKDSKGKIILRDFISSPIEFMGTVHAGATVGFDRPTDEAVAETITLQDLLAVDLHRAKLFRVQGDSMINAGIHEDDILLVECTERWNIGDMVVADIDGMETVKYIKKDKSGKLFLRPANDDLSDMYPENYLEVKAKVINVIRRVA